MRSYDPFADDRAFARVVGDREASEARAMVLIPLITYTALALAVLALGLGCKKPPEGRAQGEVLAGGVASPGVESPGIRVETFVSGVNVPWSMIFLPDGRMLFSERPGRVRAVEKGTLRPEPLLTLTDVVESGEGGLMGLAAHPRFPENHFLYLAYAYHGADAQFVRVARYREESGRLVDPVTIIDRIPSAQFHSGCRLRFGPDGKLYITTGDATEKEQAQDLGSIGGKTLRLNDDGSIPPDNPFVGRAGARGEIYSYGHRNSQGLDFQPGSGLLFQTEHGPSGSDAPGGGDEVNIVERGVNYGWPVIHHRQTRERMVSPILEYTPAVAPSGCAFYRGTAFPQYTGNFFFACLRGECLIRVRLDGRRVLSQERLLDKQYGRLRDVIEGPDGALYVATSNRDGRGSPAANDDRILRLAPAK